MNTIVNYETVLDDIIDKLEDAVEACTSFSSASTHFSYVRTEDYGDEDPICLLSLQRDVLEDIGPKETRHVYTFQARVSHVGTGTKANLNEIVSYVGEIVDKIESDRTLGSNYVANTEVVNVEYSQNAPPSYVIYFAFLTINVEGLRNA